MLRMSNQKSAMQNALEQFDSWIKNNGINKNELFSSPFMSTNASIKVQGYNQAIDIAKKLEQYTSIAEDFIDAIQSGFGISTQEIEGLTKEVFLDINKKFGDLVKEGPKTSVEQKLIDTVNTFLSPQDKKQAVDQNFSVGAVLKLIEQSMQKSQELASQTLMREKQHEREKEQKQIHKEPEKKMASLGEEYGVLNEIVKNMRQAFENSRNQVMEKSKQVFETVTIDNVNKTLKSMGRDPNHFQGNNNKSRSR
jgi:hypothetical protein